MAYIAERIRSDDRLGQAFNIRDSSREIRQNMSPIELRAYASRLDGRLGWFHIALEDFYEVKDDGEYDPELTNLFHTHLRFVRAFARRAKRPWSRFTVKLVP